MFNQKFWRYTMFGLLYFSQGTILSYFTALNAIYLLDHGLTMTDVGIFASIALIPFVIKIFLGMLSDRVNLLGMGHRKPYILLGLVIQTVCLILVPFINPRAAYWGFVGLAFVLQMGMALYDTCTDGLALDTTPKEEEGTIQAFMVGGRAVGVVITASVVGLLAQNISWSAVFWVLAGFTLLPVPLVWRVQEATRPVGRQFDWSAFGAFKQPSILALAGVGLILFAIIVGANQNVNPFLEDAFGISLSMAGFLTTIWGLGIVLGSALGGRLIGRTGEHNATRAAMAASLVALVILALTPNATVAWLLVPIFGIAYGTVQTVYFALAMTYTVPSIAASMFAILMAATNIGQGAGMALSGTLADVAGFRWTFVALGLLNFAALPLLPLIFKKGVRS